METSVRIKKNGSFTKEHLEIAKQFDKVNKELFPEHYDNSVFESLSYHGLHLIDESCIVRATYGTSQEVRADGINAMYDELALEMDTNGYKLGGGKFLWVKKDPAKPGRYLIVDGKTKDHILSTRKFKNRICHVIDIDESETVALGNRLNSGEDAPPAGLVKEADIINAARNQINKGYLELNIDDILDFIDKMLGRGKFGKKKRTDLANQIYNHEYLIQTSGLLPTAWVNSLNVEEWLKDKKYIETSTVKYLPVASSSPLRGIASAAKAAQENPNKQIRVVIYVSKLNGFNLKSCYVDTILKFKSKWFEYLNDISSTYFDNTKPMDFKVKLYGCLPSNIEDVCEDMDKLIVFGKNDQKINSNYLPSQSLNSFFDEELEEYV